MTRCLEWGAPFNLHWDEPHPGLWLQHMIPARPNAVERFDSEHLNRKMTTVQIPHPGAGQLVQPHVFCFQYNIKGFCTKKPCSFDMTVLAVGGSTQFCTASNEVPRGTWGAKKPGTSGSNLGKGAQPNQN